MGEFGWCFAWFCMLWFSLAQSWWPEDSMNLPSWLKQIRHWVPPWFLLLLCWDVRLVGLEVWKYCLLIELNSWFGWYFKIQEIQLGVWELHSLGKWNSLEVELCREVEEAEICFGSSVLIARSIVHNSLQSHCCHNKMLRLRQFSHKMWRSEILVLCS